MRMQSAECVCTELCVCLLFCYRLCEIIFLCRIYWVEVVGMERKSILNSFFPFENVKIPELRTKPAAFLGMGEKHSFCLFLTSKRKFMGFDYLRGMRLLNQTFQQHLGWQLHCVLLSLDWWMILDFGILVSRPEPLYDFTSHELLTRLEIPSL